MTNEPTVFVVDDDPALCESLCYLLKSDGLAAEAYTSAEDFLAAFDPDRPGVLVLDVRMRGMKGPELQEHLIEKDIDVPIIILTGHGDVPMAVRAVKAGALDFLQKPVNDEILLARIRQAIQLDQQNRQRRIEADSVAKRVALLTGREREVLDLLLAAKASKQMAHELCVSEKTIEVHRKHVLKKMEVNSAVELVRTVLSARETKRKP